MEYYFSTNRVFELKFFGPIHLLLILLTFFSILLIYKNKDNLKKYKSLKYWIVGILFLNMVIYLLGALFTGVFNKYNQLPLHYCYITGFFFMYMIIRDKKKMFNFLYYAIFFCTITVILFQDPGITYDRYEFILLIISHHFLLVSSFYTLYVLEYPVNRSGYRSFTIYSIIVYVSVFIINKLIGTDYIFNNTFPDFIYNYFPFIKNFPPLVWLTILSIPLLSLAYVPIKHFKNVK